MIGGLGAVNICKVDMTHRICCETINVYHLLESTPTKIKDSIINVELWKYNDQDDRRCERLAGASMTLSGWELDSD